MRSPYRIAIIKVMDKAYTTTAIWNKAKKNCHKLNRANCSKNIVAMLKQGIVECLNSNDKFGKIYGLTEEGENLREILIKSIGV